MNRYSRPKTGRTCRRSVMVMPTVHSALHLTRGRRAAVGVLLGCAAAAGPLVALCSAPGGLPYALRRSLTRRADAAGGAARSGAQDGTAWRREPALEADERARMAGEIHDLVAHGLTAMTVQAAAARRLLRSDPDTAEEMLTAVEQVGREATEEMRALVAVFSPDAPAARRPQPDLSQLADLVARARAAGVDVELVTTGKPGPVDPGTALTAYRVVEDALAAAPSRADGGRVRVTVRWGGGLVDIAVDEDGPVVDDGREPRGLRERLLRDRVVAYGGRLRTDTRSGGGLAVRATFPTRRSLT